MIDSKLSDDRAIIAERDGAVAVARLNRTEKRNALSPELSEQLAALVQEWDGDATVRCIVIAGGEEYFAAGEDVRAVAERGSQQARVESTERFGSRMGNCRTPLVAAVSGYALGSGFELALLCDMIVASEAAELGLPEVLLGIIPAGGATQRLTRVIGRQRTMELLLTGRRIAAQEAFRLGIVNKVTPKKKWLSQAIELAEVVARRPPIAVQLAKQAVLAAHETGLEAGLAEERRLLELAMATEDRLEGMRAFIEGRRPDFKGR